MWFLTLIPYNECLTESSIAEPLPNRDVIDHRASVTYHLVEEGTKRERAMPIDSIGFPYNINVKRSCATYWQCMVRPKGSPCKALAAVIDSHAYLLRNLSSHTFRFVCIERTWQEVDSQLDLLVIIGYRIKCTYYGRVILTRGGFAR